MPSTFSPSLRLELIGDGEQAGTWGQTTNTNLGTVLESAIAGVATVTTTAAKQALTVSNGAVDQARNAMLALNTTTGATYEVYIPPVPKLYAVRNLSSLYSVIVFNSTVVGNTTAAGAGVAIGPGAAAQVMSDGTNVILVGEYSDANNTPNTLVKRDADGDFSAGVVFADLVGDVTGNVLGNVTGNISGTAANVTGVVAVANGGTGASTVVAAKDALQTGRLEVNVKTAGYTLAATDVGDLVAITNGTVTIPPGVFGSGQVVVVYNNSVTSPRPIARGAGVSLYWVGGVNADRTLGIRGVATIMCVAANEFVITGQGVT